MMARSFVALLAVAPVVLAGVAVPRAAYAEDVQTRIAKRHFAHGEKLYALGKFADALDEYQQAYDAKPIAAFLFNIGQCHRGLGEYDQAIFSYKKYLREAPDAANSEKVEKLIADLEEKQAKDESHRLHVDQPDHPPPAQPPAAGSDSDGAGSAAVVIKPSTAGPPIYKKWWFWTGVAVVGVAAGVGIYSAAHGAGGPPGTDLGNIGVPP